MFLLQSDYACSGLFEHNDLQYSNPEALTGQLLSDALGLEMSYNQKSVANSHFLYCHIAKDSRSTKPASVR